MKYKMKTMIFALSIYIILSLSIYTIILHTWLCCFTLLRDLRDTFDYDVVSRPIEKISYWGHTFFIPHGM